MKPRGVLALCLLLVSCESHTVEQIAVTVPPGVTVPDKHLLQLGHRRIGFIMGHPDQPRTAGGRKVATGAYFIDRFEVSREEYNRENPVPAFNEKTASLPAANVTYDEAEAYCRKKGKRLPTETEWEKAARGTDGRKWPWSIYFDHPNGSVPSVCTAWAITSGSGRAIGTPTAASPRTRRSASR